MIAQYLDPVCLFCESPYSMESHHPVEVVLSRRKVVGGGFCRDLYYGRNVFPIHVIPHRQRVEDTPFLSTHFAKRP